MSHALDGTAIWIAINDASIGNGTLKVIPDVVDNEFTHRRDMDSDHHIRTEVDESTAITCELKAGGVVFFCFGTPHATSDNFSSLGRAGVGNHFVNANYMDARHRELWKSVELSSERSSLGLNEHGEVCDFDEQVRKLLSAPGKFHRYSLS